MTPNASKSPTAAKGNCLEDFQDGDLPSCFYILLTAPQLGEPPHPQRPLCTVPIRCHPPAQSRERHLQLLRLTNTCFPYTEHRYLSPSLTHPPQTRPIRKIPWSSRLRQAQALQDLRDVPSPRAGRVLHEVPAAGGRTTHPISTGRGKDSEEVWQGGGKKSKPKYLIPYVSSCSPPLKIPPGKQRRWGEAAQLRSARRSSTAGVSCSMGVTPT